MTDPKERFRHFNAGRANFFLVAFIALLLAAAALKLAASVILPFVIAVLLAFVIYPLVAIPERLHVPRILSILLVVALIVVALGFIGVALFSAVKSIGAVYPRYESRFNEIYRWLSALLQLPSYDDNLSLFDNLWGQLNIRNTVLNFAFSTSKSFTAFLKNAVMMLIFMIFLLMETASLRERVDAAFEKGSSGQLMRISADIMRQISRYLSLKFIISLVTGLIVGVGLKLIGLEFAVLWGIIQFILNFIPTLGSLAVGFGASLFALLQFWPDPAPIILVVAVMLGTNMIIGNILEPKIMGDNLGLSPLVVLLSLLIWGGLWDFAGMVLAVPMTMIVKIICENVPVLEPVSILLGSRKAATAKPQQ